MLLDKHYPVHLHRKEAVLHKLLKHRFHILIEELKQKYPDKKILLVTHSAIARVIHYYITGIPKDNDLTKLEIPNCSVRVYEIKKGE